MSEALEKTLSLWKRLPGVAFRLELEPPFTLALIAGDLSRVSNSSPEDVRADPQRLLDRVHPEDKAVLSSLFEPKLVRDGEVFTSARLAALDGSYRWWVIYAVTVPPEGACRAHVEVIGLELPSAWQRMRGAFHDLNNMLMAVELNVTGLARALARDELARVWIEDMQEATGHAINLVRSSLRRPPVDARDRNLERNALPVRRNGENRTGRRHAGFS